MAPENPTLLAVSVGNTRTSFASFRLDALPDPTDRATQVQSSSLPNADRPGLLDALTAAAGGLDPSGIGVVLASVNEEAAASLVGPLVATGADVLRLGDDVAVPIATVAEGVGQDRFLNAIAAHHASQGACVVVDAGTAVTVDFVDGACVFQGGCIVPGAAMMLRSLHEGTSRLPLLEASVHDIAGQPYPPTTQDAMRAGVTHALRGLVRSAAERYAEAYGAYPPVIATGGDAAWLFGGDEFVERIFDGLALMGLAIAVRDALAAPAADA